MRGRYSFAVEPTEVEDRFQAAFAEPTQPRFNAASSQRLLVILNTAPGQSSWLPGAGSPSGSRRCQKRMV